MRIFFIVCLVILGSILLATGLGYAVNHWILGQKLFLVIDLIIGVIFGLPLALLILLLLNRRYRRQKKKQITL